MTARLALAMTPRVDTTPSSPLPITSILRHTRATNWWTNGRINGHTVAPRATCLRRLASTSTSIHLDHSEDDIIAPTAVKKKRRIDTTAVALPVDRLPARMVDRNRGVWETPTIGRARSSNNPDWHLNTYFLLAISQLLVQ